MNQNVNSMNSSTMLNDVPRETAVNLLKDAGDPYARLGAEMDLMFKRLMDAKQDTNIDRALIRSMARSMRRHADELFDAMVELENYVDANLEEK